MIVPIMMLLRKCFVLFSLCCYLVASGLASAHIAPNSMAMQAPSTMMAPNADCHGDSMQASSNTNEASQATCKILCAAVTHAIDKHWKHQNTVTVKQHTVFLPLQTLLSRQLSVEPRPPQTTT